MRTAITLVLLMLTLLILNVLVARVGSPALSALATLTTYFVNAVTIAAIVSNCPMRSTWIAFSIVAGIFLFLGVSSNKALLDVVRLIVPPDVRLPVARPVDEPASGIKDNMSERLVHAIAISSPLFAGTAAAIAAVIFFPGKRQRKFMGFNYPMFKQ